MTIRGILFLLSLVVLANGAISIARSRSMQRVNPSNPAVARRAKRIRDMGVVTFACGVTVFLGSLLLIAKRGF